MTLNLSSNDTLSNPTRSEKNTFIATLVDGKVKLECHFKFAELPKMAGGEWDYTNRCWWLPATVQTLEMLRGVRQALIDDAVSKAISNDLDGAPDPIPEDLEGIIAKMPVKIRPYDHQAAAFKRCMEVFGGD